MMDDKEMSSLVDGNDSNTGHIISTIVGAKMKNLNRHLVTWQSVVGTGPFEIVELFLKLNSNHHTISFFFSCSHDLSVSIFFSLQMISWHGWH